MRCDNGLARTNTRLMGDTGVLGIRYNQRRGRMIGPPSGGAREGVCFGLEAPVFERCKLSYSYHVMPVRTNHNSFYLYSLFTLHPPSSVVYTESGLGRHDYRVERKLTARLTSWDPDDPSSNLCPLHHARAQTSANPLTKQVASNSR